VLKVHEQEQEIIELKEEIQELKKLKVETKRLVDCIEIMYRQYKSWNEIPEIVLKEAKEIIDENLLRNKR